MKLANRTPRAALRALSYSPLHLESRRGLWLKRSLWLLPAMISWIFFFGVAWLSLPAQAAAQAQPQWSASTQAQPTQVVVTAVVRYAGCGEVASLVRLVGGQETTVWTNAETALVAEDFEVDCACEPLGTWFGTGSKHCPEQQCQQTEQCGCSNRCQPLADSCPPQGQPLTWELRKADGTVLATASLASATFPGCEPVAQPDTDAPADEDSGGCYIAGISGGLEQTALWGGVGLLGILVVLLLVARRVASDRRSSAARPVLRSLLPGCFWAGRPRLGCVRFRGTRLATVLLVALLLTSGLLPGCRRDKDQDKKDKAAAAKAATQPIQVVIAGSPWEPVVVTWNNIQALFDKSSDPEETLALIRAWRDEGLTAFQAACDAALKFYDEDPPRRLGYVSQAGLQWASVRTNLQSRSATWTTVQQHELQILLNELECR